VSNEQDLDDYLDFSGWIDLDFKGLSTRNIFLPSK
jgi:hypothetical protein